MPGGPRLLPFERASQLAACLALKGTWTGRAEVAALLWPGQEGKLAYANLRKTLFRMQSGPFAHAVEVQGGALRLDVATDVADFEAAMRDGRVADALALRRGEFLAGFDDDGNDAWTTWLQFERERRRAEWRDASLAHLATEIAAAEAIEISARLLEADPLDEAALRAHMEWLDRNGQAAAARQAYRVFTERLATDLGLAPGADLEALHDSLATARGIAPAPATPAAGDGFVGRSVELRRLGELLGHAGCRVLTVLGPGGIGKTRLARQALRELSAAYPDGTALVELEDCVDAQGIAAGIARACNVSLASRRDTLDQVIEALAPRRALLVLDNFEHLAAYAGIVARLYQACPRVAILVTSRVRLGLAEEHVLPLEGLPFPDAEDEDRFDAFDAVRLFVRAARRVDPALVPAAEAAAIVDICRQVDGLPLAIELAAAWTRVMTCAAIAAQLREGTLMLHAADGSQPARHASLEVVFEASWNLLNARERDALARLAIFHGGFTVEAARTVAGAPLPVLGALVDKSLLRKEGARLYLHPLLQQLAAQRLAGTPAQDETHGAHAQHFHRMLARQRRAAEGGDRNALDEIDLEFGNCRSAWRWALAQGMGAMALASVRTLLAFCDHRLRLEDGLALLSEAIASPAAAAEPRLEARALSASAHLEYRLDRYATAEALAARSLESPGTDEESRLQCLKVIGACSLRLGRPEEARRAFQQALKLQPARVDPRNAAAMLDNLALVEKNMGRYAESLRLSHQSLLQHRVLNESGGEALCLNNLGTLEVDMGQYDAGRAHLRESLALSERHGLAGTRALALCNLLELELKTGDLESAEAYAPRAVAAVAATGQRSLAAALRVHLASLAIRRRDFDAARLEIATSLETAIALARPSLLCLGLRSFAELLHAQGEAGCARSVLEFCAAHPTVPAAERDLFSALLREMPPIAAPAWPGIALEELAHRIVIERDLAHAPLIAALTAPETVT